MISDWIIDENLRAFLETLGRILDYQFGSDEIKAIELGARDADGDADRWYEFEIAGTQGKCDMRLARDSGTSVIQLRLNPPERATERVAVAVSIFQTYHIRAHNH
jgi:hypothetical protein